MFLQERGGSGHAADARPADLVGNDGAGHVHAVKDVPDVVQDVRGHIRHAGQSRGLPQIGVRLFQRGFRQFALGDVHVHDHRPFTGTCHEEGGGLPQPDHPVRRGVGVFQTEVRQFSREDGPDACRDPRGIFGVFPGDGFTGIQVVASDRILMAVARMGGREVPPALIHGKDAAVRVEQGDVRGKRVEDGRLGIRRLPLEHLAGAQGVLRRQLAGHIHRQHELRAGSIEIHRVRGNFHRNFPAVLCLVTHDAGPVGATVPGREMLNFHPEEFFPRVAVANHGGVVDGQEAGGVRVVGPHRVRVLLEELAVAGFARFQDPDTHPELEMGHHFARQQGERAGLQGRELPHRLVDNA